VQAGEGEGGVTRDYSQTLEIEAPAATCGHCRFTSALSGAWSVEDGRLVWRAEADPQPRRGPDLHSCCESSPVIEFTSITAEWGDREFSSEEIAALRATAEHARLHEFDEEGPARDQEA
jgi:hypothetical protein